MVASKLSSQLSWLLRGKSGCKEVAESGPFLGAADEWYPNISHV